MKAGTEKTIASLVHGSRDVHTYTSFSPSLQPTWFTSSGMPRALSISSKPVASVLLKRVCSWSSNALSSFCPSILEGGPRRSSREFLRSGLKKTCNQSQWCFSSSKQTKRKQKTKKKTHTITICNILMCKNNLNTVSINNELGIRA